MPPSSRPHFAKGDRVEVIRRETGPVPPAATYYPAVVLDPPGARKPQVLVEFLTLMVHEPDGPRRVRELVDLGNLRPDPPRELNEWFRVEDCVDVYSEHGWQRGTVVDILENSRYIVGVRGRREKIVSEQCNLRLHREWDDASWEWDPPLQKSSVSEEGSSGRIRVKVKILRPKKPGPMFEQGKVVEVTSDVEGFRGAWFTAIVVGPAGTDSLLVQYMDLVTDDGSAPLREIAKIQHVRPNPPWVDLDTPFKLLDKVDAWFNEAWWEGVVSKVLDGFKYVVYFSYSCESMVIAHSQLRPHQDWVDGKWIKGQSMELNIDGRHVTEKFIKETKVEVKSNKNGFLGAWFPATVVHVVGNDKYVVQYHTLLADDGSFLKEEASSTDIRPSCPYIPRYSPFETFEIVDAWHNDGWWVGRIIQVQKEMKYTIQLLSAEKLEFEHRELRPHQEWMEGNWITVYKV
ncbi:hypothetical protein Tsubulata_026639 [Turnera subulata]|uniref:Agenet domain-containing protein n=1 Tax=Turnera subulata TaxID=218843 RepID=A0A9Q0JHR3_9ROSI|nr:hypothetical protein Tsubulata_026639 [Turnera subulata]